MNKNYILYLLTVLFALTMGNSQVKAQTPNASGIIYVTTSGAGNKSGNSWTNASDDLQMAINTANVQQVWVAGGTYKPKYRADDMSDANANDRNNAFILKNNVKIYGGFAGGETLLTDRNLNLSANASILSGDLGTANVTADNAYHVVISAGAVGTAELNGFTITNGNANGNGYIMVNTKVIFRSSGGGIYNHESSPVLTHVIISANTTTTGGGGISNNASYPVLTNVSINGNTATNAGGGIYNYESSPFLTNVTISANTANFGGGISNSDPNSKPQIRNSIIYGNNTGIEGAGTPVISYSLVQGLSSTTNGNIDGSTNPEFVDAANGDYSLKNTSPLINKGSDTYFDAGQTPNLSAITTDIAGNTRIQKGYIDLGAYESPYNTPLAPNANGIIYVTTSGAGNKSGDSWDNATDDLQMAINATGVQQVWVAKGTYKPKYRADNMSGANANDRYNAFVLKNNVKIYGGFVGGDNTLADRNLSLSANASILSGDLGTVNTNTDNAYHVVISAGAVGTAELNGFTLTGGNANGIGNITVNSKTIDFRAGGGIYNHSSSPVLSNIIISENMATNFGGGIYNTNTLSAPVLSNVTISSNTAHSGGGIFNDDNSTPILSNVIISSNTANSLGGGISNNFSSPILSNVIISSNTVTSGNGGGIYNNSSSPVLTNVTISRNTAGGIYNSNANSKPKIRNSIIYGNNSGMSGGVPVVSYSLVQGLSSTTNGNIDGSTNPEFVDAANGDYSLKNTSPLINKGSNTYFNAGQTPNLSAITTDIAGNTRMQKGYIDLGAYESPYNTPLAPNANGIIYVTTSGAGNQSGNSWANATNDLQMAINATNVQQVWVAGGTYKPMYRADNMSDANANDRNSAFVLKNNVKVYGGFAGTETALTDRDLSLSTNASILSGDIGNENDDTDNAYHVVISADAVGTAELNGFTIKDGNANGYEFITVNSKEIMPHDGGGIYNASSSPALTHVTISGNTANINGGGILNDASSPVLTNVSISANTANEIGGGIYNSSSSPVLTHVTISENTATSSGGGIYNYSSLPVLTNVTISTNTASYGGGISNDYSSPVLTNVTISENTTTNNGGGIYNSSSSPVLTHVTISKNTANGIGGGIFNYTSSPGLTNVTISENTADNGGGIFNYSSLPVLTNVTISSNTASYFGGGIFNNSSSPVLTNVTISENTANDSGGGIYNYNLSSTPQIRNSIIYGNNSGISGPGISGPGTPVISYSLVQGLSSTANNNIDGNTNPMFTNATTGNYTLANGSPAIGAGNNSYYTDADKGNGDLVNDLDLAGKPRLFGTNIDMGAYENQEVPLSPNANGVIYVTHAGAGNKTGNSWTNASDDLQMAINATNVQQVWVAKGTYKPKYRADNMSAANPNDRNNAFVLKNNVKVYGGFAGTETSLGDRDLSNTANATTLSGDFNGDDAGFTNNGENAYHVVVSSGNDNSAMLNGFTLSGANASSSTDILINGNQVYQCSGGGIYLSVSSPVLQNLMITRNKVGESGGGIFGYESSPVLSGITMQGNQAKDGGGMANQSQSSPVLSNIIITENEATELGGGLYNVTSSSPVLTNVTISANTATNGGGIYNDGSSSNPQIHNSIIYGNNTGIEGNGTPVVSYSLVQGLSSTANGNIDGSTNPQFVDASNGDYSLKNTSPAINAGSNSLYIGLDANTKDLAGNARLVGTNIDMGAYENQDGALPVTLVNYTAKASGNQVKLQWQTAEEQNNKGFVIYRSGDNTLFTPIGEVPVTDNLQSKTYNFTDINPLNGNNYYKLVQVDKDGTATELGIRTVTFNFPLSTFNLYPNPTTELVHSSFSSNSYNLLTIADLNGRVLQQLQIQAGESSITVSLADYPAGTYLLRFSGKDGAVIKKVVKR